MVDLYKIERDKQGLYSIVYGEKRRINTKNDIKELVRAMYKDVDNISDGDLNDFIYESIIPRLKELGVNIAIYNEKTNESGYEIILKENY